MPRRKKMDIIPTSFMDSKEQAWELTINYLRERGYVFKVVQPGIGYENYIRVLSLNLSKELCYCPANGEWWNPYYSMEKIYNSRSLIVFLEVLERKR